MDHRNWVRSAKSGASVLSPFYPLPMGASPGGEISVGKPLSWVGFQSVPAAYRESISIEKRN
jgi:hypothetical protein